MSVRVIYRKLTVIFTVIFQTPLSYTQSTGKSVQNIKISETVACQVAGEVQFDSTVGFRESSALEFGHIYPCGRVSLKKRSQMAETHDLTVRPRLICHKLTLIFI